MNRIVLAIIGILAAALLAGFIIVAMKPRSAPAPQKNQITQTEPSTEVQTPGSYIAYTQDAFANAQGRRVLFFHAGWCPQCRELETSINAGGIPNAMTIFKVDYDTATALRQTYGVTLQTTVVEVDSSGALLKKHVAYNEPSLPAVLKALE